MSTERPNETSSLSRALLGQGSNWPEPGADQPRSSEMQGRPPATANFSLATMARALQPVYAQRHGTASMSCGICNSLSTVYLLRVNLALPARAFLSRSVALPTCTFARRKSGMSAHLWKRLAWQHVARATAARHCENM